MHKTKEKKLPFRAGYGRRNAISGAQGLVVSVSGSGGGGGRGDGVVHGDAGCANNITGSAWCCGRVDGGATA